MDRYQSHWRYIMTTKENSVSGNEIPLRNFTRLWHLATFLLCIAALSTGELADDYKKTVFTGYIIHGQLGLTTGILMISYLLYGLVGPSDSRFISWFPLKKENLQKTKKDLAELTKLKLPEHERRQGLAGLVQFLGVLAFCWMAATGFLFFLLAEPGHKARGLLHAIKEAHEAGVVLIALYLAAHVGAVIMHAVKGNHHWKEIFFFKKD